MARDDAGLARLQQPAAGHDSLADQPDTAGQPDERAIADTAPRGRHLAQGELLSTVRQLVTVPVPVVAAVCVVAVGVGVWWWSTRASADSGVVLPALSATTNGTGAGLPPPSGDPAAAPSAAVDGSSPSSTSVPTASATVHVAGAVASPGIVVVTPGARIVDAVTGAGGWTSEADLAGVNLAAVVVDGQMIVVPTPGQPGMVAGGAPGPGSGTAGGAAASALIDINTADVATLEGLPGIGPVLAQRIVDWRTDTGQFRQLEDLLAVPGIGSALVEEIRDLVTV